MCRHVSSKDYWESLTCIEYQILPKSRQWVSNIEYPSILNVKYLLIGKHWALISEYETTNAKSAGKTTKYEISIFSIINELRVFT